MRKLVASIIILLMITGCAATGERYRSDVYRSDQVNRVQQGKVVIIKTVTPAKIEVDNSEQKEKAKIGGAILGALAGGLGTGLSTHSTGAGLAGAAAGGLVGAGTSEMLTHDKVLVDGVTITYIVEETGEIRASTQVGRICEFDRNSSALMITTEYGETRIQPNATCLE